MRREIAFNKVLIFLLFLFLSFSVNLSAEESKTNSVSNDIIFSPPKINGDYFLPIFGRLTSSNDFFSRSSKSPELTSFLCSASNMHGRRSAYFEIDSELYTCGFSYERNVLNDLRLSISGEFISAGGGVFDSFIYNYHNALGFPNGPRNRNNQNRYVARGQLRSGEEFTIEREDFGFSDPVISLSYNIFDLSSLDKLYIDNSLNIPISLSKYSLSIPDLRLSLVLEGKRKLFFYVMGYSLIHHSDNLQHGIRYKSFHHGGFLSLNIPIDNTFHLLISLMGRSVITDEILRFSGYAIYLDTGIRIILKNKHFIDTIVRENPVPARASVDVSLIVSYTFLL